VSGPAIPGKLPEGSRAKSHAQGQAIHTEGELTAASLCVGSNRIPEAVSLHSILVARSFCCLATMRLHHAAAAGLRNQWLHWLVYSENDTAYLTG
jgi:hypothetical protein